MFVGLRVILFEQLTRMFCMSKIEDFETNKSDAPIQKPQNFWICTISSRFSRIQKTKNSNEGLDFLLPRAHVHQQSKLFFPHFLKKQISNNDVKSSFKPVLSPYQKKVSQRINLQSCFLLLTSHHQGFSTLELHFSNIICGSLNVFQRIRAVFSSQQKTLCGV